jgi:hypothetical protein
MSLFIEARVKNIIHCFLPILDLEVSIIKYSLTPGSEILLVNCHNTNQQLLAI